MLKAQSTRVAQLLLVGLLTLMLAVFILSATVQTRLTANDGPHPIVQLQIEPVDRGATAVIACNGGSEGACGG